jgi:photosystem II stability/assembly factor-like uncharacterized protein
MITVSPVILRDPRVSYVHPHARGAARIPLSFAYGNRTIAVYLDNGAICVYLDWESEEQKAGRRGRATQLYTQFPWSMRFFRIVWIVLMVPFASFSQQIQWKDINGIPPCSKVCLGASNRIFAISQYSIYYSDDTGRTWEKNSLQGGEEGGYANSGGVLVSPRWFRSYNPYRIYLSTDNGASWKRILGSSTDRLFVHPLVVSNAGVVVGIASNAQGYAALKRYDGQHWVDLGNPSFILESVIDTAALFLFIDHADDFFMAAQNYGLAYSHDTGMSWHKALPWRYVTALGLTPDNQLLAGATPTSILAGGLGGGVLLSSDAGITWTKLGLKDKTINGVTADAAGTVFVAAENGLFRLTLNADAWEDVSPSHDNFTGVLVGAPGNVFTTNTSVIYRSTDGGSTWHASGPRDRPVFAIAATLSGTILSGTLGSRIFRSTDGGSRWEHSAPGTVGDNVYSMAVSGAVAYAATDEGLSISTDEGTGWVNISAGSVSGSAYAVVVARDGTVSIGTNFGVYSSTDEGGSWRLSGLGESAVLFLAIDSAGSIFAATANDGVFVLQDGGTLWKGIGLVRDDIQTIAVNAAGDVFVGVYGGIFTSTDGGISWTVHTFGESYVYSLAVGLGGILFAGTYNGVFVSYDGGVAWRDGGLDGYSILSLAVDGQQNLIAGTNGNGLYKSTAPVTSVREGAQEMLPHAISLGQNYPNPFNPTTSVWYSVPRTGAVSLRVYDILGREVATLVDNIRQRGEYTVEWNAELMPSGIYLYKLVAGGSIETRKAVLIR